MTFETLHQLFENLEKRHDIKEMPLITGGVGYTESREFLFELNTNLKKKQKFVKVIIYRFETGRYELVDYVC